MHIIPFCVKIALSTTHIAVCISHNSKYCARMLYTRMLTRQFFNDSCHTSRVSSMQHSSDIEPVTHLGYQTRATRAYDELCRCLIRIFDPFKWETQCKDYTQCRFYAEPIRKAGFARDRNAGFIRDPYAMGVLHGTSPIPQVFYDPLRCLPKHLSKF